VIEGVKVADYLISQAAVNLVVTQVPGKKTTQEFREELKKHREVRAHHANPLRRHRRRLRH
jgi:hypothetical protein